MNGKPLLGMVAILVVGGLIWFTGSGSEEIATTNTALLAVKSDDYVTGPEDASVTLIEYLDFECEACAAYFPLVNQLEQEFPSDLRVVRRYFPLPGHKNGFPAALAVEAAAQQGKYHEMHDLLFQEQKNWGEAPVPTPEVFEGYAQQLGLDMDTFKSDVASEALKDRVQRDVDSGVKLGNTGTPSFFLNGQKIQSPRSFEDFKVLIETEVMNAPTS